MDDGAILLRALKVRRRILNSILDLTGSQCSEANTGDMCSLFFVLVRTRAAAFWTSCRVFNYFLLEPDNKELQ